MKAVVERTQVELETRDVWFDRRSLLWTALEGHLPVVQYLCEQGADKDKRDMDGLAPLYWAADKGHLHEVQYPCEQGGIQP